MINIRELKDYMDEYTIEIIQAGKKYSSTPLLDFYEWLSSKQQEDFKKMRKDND